MRARIVNMDKNIRTSLGLYLWQVFEVKKASPLSKLAANIQEKQSGLIVFEKKVSM